MELLAIIGGNVALLAVFGWLTKSFIGQLLKKDMERLRYDLQRTFIEYQIKFSNFHEKRVEVVAEIYSRTVQVHNELYNIVKHGFPDDNLKYEHYYDANKPMRDFKLYFDKK